MDASIPANQSATEESMMKIALLYYMGQPGNARAFDTITLDPVIEGPVRSLRQQGLVTIKTIADGDYYVPSAAGQQYINAVRDMFDRVRDLEIFARVYLAEALPDTVCGSDGIVYDNLSDPRFFTKQFAAERPDLPTADMRIWMISYLNQKLAGNVPPISPHIAVFVQRLIDNEFESPGNLWISIRLGRVFREIDNVVKTAFPNGTILYPDVPEHTAQYWFDAGMREITKQRGSRCSACQSQLGIAETEARAQKQELANCPYCKASFSAPPAPPAPTYAEYCPNCQGGVHPHHTHCHSCNLSLNRSLAPGEIVTRIESVPYVTEHVEYYPTTVFLTPDPLYSIAAWSAFAIML